MKKRRTTHLSMMGGLFLLLLVVLASIGVSYAMWTDILNAEGTVTTWDEPASVSDFVWHDIDQDGIQDPGEPGIPNVIVNLYWANGTFKATTTTDEDGLYLFDDLIPGDYYLEFILPDLYSFTQQDAGTDETDSDADPLTGQTILIFLSPGNDDTWDAGLWTPYEGCSHGFWKTHHNEWVTYDPNDHLDTVFSFPEELQNLATDTLDDALWYQGGNDLIGGAQILLRNAVASVLNAAHPNVNYPLTEAEVIDEVNTALASLDRGAMIALNDLFDYYNNLHGSCVCD